MTTLTSAVTAAQERIPTSPPSQTATMRAAVIVEPGKCQVREVALPRPAAGQVRVRLEGCGVCASNIPPWEGRPWFNYPLSPGQLGHEGWGVIDELGEGVRHLSIGQRVAMLSDNAYAEYDVTAAEKVVPLPRALDGQPLPGEPLGCAVNIFRRCGIEPGHDVAIVGIGFLGALLTQMACKAGARVIAISRRPDSLDVARRAGADQVVPMDDHWRVINRVAELTGGSGGYDVKGFCDVVIECTGKQWPLDLAAEMCGVRGRLVIAGYHQDGLRQANVQLWNWRGLDVINAHERDVDVYVEGIRAAVRAVEAGEITPAPLYTHRFPLEQLDVALNATKDRPDGFVKALVMME
jgi:threonine dehydrogenase-like Zn-dependent dehydrogenase